MGASTWASGSQVWSGTTGTLIAKASAKAPNSHVWVLHHGIPSPPSGTRVSSSA